MSSNDDMAVTLTRGELKGLMREAVLEAQSITSNDQQPPPEWMTIEQTAELLGVHKGTVSNYMKKRDLPFRQLGGGVIRISRSELADWMNRQEGSPRLSVVR